MIPGLDLDTATQEQIESAFANWSDHFRRKLNLRDVPGLLADYERLVRSVETRSCEHGHGLNMGDQWQQCCGISYEYTNDLAVRDAIEIIVQAVPSASPQLRQELSRLDERLYALYEHRPLRIDRWWRSGLPAGIVE
jgi:hypothetical protein